MAKVKLVINKDIQKVGIGRKDIEEGLAIPIFSVVPMDSETAQTALNQGEPFVVKFPKSFLAHALEGMTDKILGAETPAEVSQNDGPLLKLKKMLFGS
jgi:pilus assembly protein CpaE